MKGLPSLAVVCALSAVSAGARAAVERTPEGRLVIVRGGESIVRSGCAGPRSNAQRCGESIAAPLEHTDVQIRIDGPIADATVTQRFRNPHPARTEAVYQFPLPPGAAVSELRIATGTRTITGAIRERAKARPIYERARGRGQIAALLAQARPDLFVHAVASIEPGATVEVTLRYAQRLEPEGGRHELMFPIGSRPHGAHDLALRVELDAGVPIASIDSPSHAIAVTRDGTRATIRLAAGDTGPGRDFVLRYGAGGAGPEFGVLAHRDGGTGSFLLIAQPPVVAAPALIAPRELVFVLDTSSSMRGAPLEQARRLILKLLLSLRPDDTFQIVRIDDHAGALGPAPIANRPHNIELTLRWLASLEAGGASARATDASGIAAALALPHDPARLRVVALLTGGHLGEDVVARAAARLGDARLFCVGLGSSVDRAVLDELAALGRGAVQVVRPDEDAAAAIAAFQHRIDAPVATDLRIDWGDLAVRDAPRAIPDLFAGQPIVVAGRYDRAQTGIATIHARLGGRDVRFDVPVALPERAARPAIASLWARQRIAELSRQLARKAAPDREREVEREVVALALEHHLLTPYTAFVAVDDGRAAGQRVAVPVEVPAVTAAIPAHGTFGLVNAYPGGVGSGATYTASGPPRISRPLFGPHIAIPPAISTRNFAAAGTIDRAILRRYIRRRLDAVRYCYEKALVARPELRGTVTAHFTVSASGRVQGASATGLGDREVDACIVKVIESIEFPAVPDGTPTAVNYPFTLVPSALTAAPAPEESP
jgi:Ca-activated chloride channel family protein